MNKVMNPTLDECTEMRYRFNNVKRYMTEDNGKVPNSREVWEQMKKVAERNKEEAFMMDMPTESYQRRIQLIDLALSNQPD